MCAILSQTLTLVPAMRSGRRRRLRSNASRSTTRALRDDLVCRDRKRRDRASPTLSPLRGCVAVKAVGNAHAYYIGYPLHDKDGVSNCSFDGVIPIEVVRGRAA